MVNGHVLRYGGKNRFFYFLCFWFRVFVYWVVRVLLLQSYKHLKKVLNYLIISKIKYFPIAFYSYKKRIPQKRTKLSGKTDLTEIYTFHMINQIRVEY